METTKLETEMDLQNVYICSSSKKKNRIILATVTETETKNFEKEQNRKHIQDIDSFHLLKLRKWKLLSFNHHSFWWQWMAKDEENIRISLFFHLKNILSLRHKQTLSCTSSRCSVQCTQCVCGIGTWNFPEFFGHLWMGYRIESITCEIFHVSVVRVY